MPDLDDLFAELTAASAIVVGPLKGCWHIDGCKPIFTRWLEAHDAELLAGEATPPKLRKLEGWVEERVEWLKPLKDPSAVLVNLERDVHRMRPNTYIDYHGQEFILTHHDVWVDDNERGGS